MTPTRDGCDAIPDSGSGHRRTTCRRVFPRNSIRPTRSRVKVRRACRGWQVERFAPCTTSGRAARIPASGRSAARECRLSVRLRRTQAAATQAPGSPVAAAGWSAATRCAWSVAGRSSCRSLRASRAPRSAPRESPATESPDPVLGRLGWCAARCACPRGGPRSVPPLVVVVHRSCSVVAFDGKDAVRSVVKGLPGAFALDVQGVGNHAAAGVRSPRAAVKGPRRALCRMSRACS